MYKIAQLLNAGGVPVTTVTHSKYSFDGGALGKEGELGGIYRMFYHWRRYNVRA